MSLAAADSSTGTTPAPRRRALTALAGALCALGAFAGTAAADVTTPVFSDPKGDSGDATDLLSNQITHVENDPGTAADDQLLLTSRLSKADQGARFTADDRVVWYLNTDNDPATGGPGTLPGFSAIGAEYSVVLFGPASGQTVPDIELRSWNGTDFQFVRDLTASEVVISEALGIVGLQVPRADVGVARGSTLALVQFSRTASGSATDFAPDSPPRYTLTIPPTPVPPAVAPAVSTVAAGESRLTVAATVDPRGLPTTFRFQYGTSTAYGSETSTGDAGAGSGPVPVTGTVTGLTPGTTYHFRIVAVNAAGTTYGPDQAATTTGPVPTAETGDALVTGPRTAVLTATVGTRGVAGTARFAWGTSPRALSSRTRFRTVSGDRITLRATLTDLTPNRRYHYRVIVQSPGGRTEGRVLSFVARQTRVLADVTPRRGPAAGGRTALAGLTTRVRVVSAATGRTVPGRRALRGARLTVTCLSGCRLTERLPLAGPAATAGHVGGPRAAFWRAPAGASPGQVTVPVRRSGRGVSLDLAPLFSDGGGHAYMFPRGAAILVRASGPGLIPSATRLAIGPGLVTSRCALSGGRAVGCRVR